MSFYFQLVKLLHRQWLRGKLDKSPYLIFNAISITQCVVKPIFLKKKEKVVDVSWISFLDFIFQWAQRHQSMWPKYPRIMIDWNFRCSWHIFYEKIFYISMTYSYLRKTLDFQNSMFWLAYTTTSFIQMMCAWFNFTQEQLFLLITELNIFLYE